MTRRTEIGFFERLRKYPCGICNALCKSGIWTMQKLVSSGLCRSSSSCLDSSSEGESFYWKQSIGIAVTVNKIPVRLFLILTIQLVVPNTVWVGGNRSKERDRKSELVLGSTYQIFELDRNNSDKNFDFWETNRIAADRIF